MMKTAPGRRLIFRMPPSVALQLASSPPMSLAASFFVMPVEVAVELARLELVEQADALLDRDEVGEHAAEPALVDVGLAGARRLLGDRLLGLLLGADEEDAARRGRRSRGRRRGRASRRLTVWARSMMWIPLRSAKMNGRILGFQRRVWWPKWTPASRSWRIETVGTGMDLLSVVPPRALPRDRATSRLPGTDPKRGLAPRVISPAVFSARRRPPGVPVAGAESTTGPPAGRPVGAAPRRRSGRRRRSPRSPDRAVVADAAADRLATRAAPRPRGRVEPGGPAGPSRRGAGPRPGAAPGRPAAW